MVDKVKKVIDGRAQRVIFLLAGVVILAGAFYLGSVIARGSGRDEQRIIESVFATLSKKYITADITTAQVGPQATVSINGKASLVDMNRLSLAGSIETKGVSAVKTDMDIRGLLAKGDMYVKTSGLGSAATALLAAIPEAKLHADEAISKIQGRWLAIPRGDDTDATSTMTCIANMFHAVQRDEAAKKQLANIYKKHRFIFVKHAEKKDKITTYAVRFDARILESFIRALQSSDLYTSHAACKKQATRQITTQQNQQSTAAQSESFTVRFSITDANELQSVSIASAKEHESALHITAKLSYQPVMPQPIPTEDIVPFSAISSDLSQVTGIFRQAALQHQQMSQIQQLAK